MSTTDSYFKLFISSADRLNNANTSANSYTVSINAPFLMETRNNPDTLYECYLERFLPTDPSFTIAVEGDTFYQIQLSIACPFKAFSIPQNSTNTTIFKNPTFVVPVALNGAVDNAAAARLPVIVSKSSISGTMSVNVYNNTGSLITAREHVIILVFRKITNHPYADRID